MKKSIKITDINKKSFTSFLKMEREILKIKMPQINQKTAELRIKHEKHERRLNQTLLLALINSNLRRES